MSLVTLGNSKLRYGGSATNNCTMWSGGIKCLITVLNNTSYSWIEGYFNADAASGSDAGYGIYADAWPADFNRYRHITVTGATTYGIKIENPSSIKIEHVKAINNATGFLLMYIYGFYANDLIAANNSIDGITYHSSQGVNNKLRAYNNGRNGIYLGGTWEDGTTYVDMVATSNAGIGIGFDQGWDTLFYRLTSIGNGGNGVSDLFWSSDTLVGRVLTANNTGHGLFVDRSADSEFHQIVSAHNGGKGIYSDQDSNLYKSVIKLGNNGTGDCYDTGGGTTPGINGSCAIAGTYISGANLSSTFSGAVTDDDSSNTSDLSGAQFFASITDWLNFSSPLRFWGKTGGGLLDSALRGQCNSGACRIWDFSISATDTVLKNLSNNGSSANEAFVNGGNCPAAVHGNKSIALGSFGPFLENAAEIIDDGIGNDNGICESNEDCIYLPDLGAGNLPDPTPTSQCVFQNGTVSNVRMYGF